MQEHTRRFWSWAWLMAWWMALAAYAVTCAGAH